VDSVRADFGPLVANDMAEPQDVGGLVSRTDSEEPYLQLTGKGIKVVEISF